MNQTRTLKVLTGLLVLLMVLTVSVSSVQSQTSQTMTADDGSTVNVVPAAVDWQKVYGGSGDDRAFHAVTVGDGFLVVGSKTENSMTVGWALRLNADGSVVWNKTYLVGDSTELRYIVPAGDGFWFVGNQLSGNLDGYILHVDSEGNKVWDTLVGGDREDKLFSGVADAGCLTVFGLSSSYGSGSSCAWAVKLDEDGNILWNRPYGRQSAHSALRSGVLHNTGGSLAAGYIEAGSDGGYEFYLLQLDPEGNMVWNKTLGGVDSEKAYSITAVSDGYVLVGDKTTTETSTDAYVVKVDGIGNQVWARTLGDKEADSPAYVTPSADGGILVCGFTFSAGAGNRDFWLSKLSADGNVLFSITAGDEAFQEAYAVIEAGDKYVLFGWTDPQGQPDLIGKRLYDFWVVKLSAPVQYVVSGLGFEVYIYIAAILAIVAVAVLLLLKLRRKK